MPAPPPRHCFLLGEVAHGSVSCSMNLPVTVETFVEVVPPAPPPHARLGPRVN